MRVVWSDLSYEGLPGNVTHLNAIQESLNNMLSTSPGERLFNPQFGCNLEGMLFELCDEVTADMIRIELFKCLGRWDPRIGVNLAMTSVTALPEEFRFNINLVLEVLGIEEATPFQFSLNSLSQSKVKI